MQVNIEGECESFILRKVWNMKKISNIYPAEKKELYRLLKMQIQGFIDSFPYLTANLANISALLNEALEDINWVGFYLLEEGKLILGPFQGRVACVEISVGKGVCGTAAAKDEIMLVENVHEFPGHIACDSASNSEIVLPIHKDGKVIGVLDIDSPHIARFDEEDKAGLAEAVKIIEKMWSEQQP